MQKYILIAACLIASTGNAMKMSSETGQISVTEFKNTLARIAVLEKTVKELQREHATPATTLTQRSFEHQYEILDNASKKTTPLVQEESTASAVKAQLPVTQAKQIIAASTPIKMKIGYMPYTGHMPYYSDSSDEI